MVELRLQFNCAGFPDRAPRLLRVDRFYSLVILVKKTAGKRRRLPAAVIVSTSKKLGLRS